MQKHPLHGARWEAHQQSEQSKLHIWKYAKWKKIKYEDNWVKTKKHSFLRYTSHHMRLFKCSKKRSQQQSKCFKSNHWEHVKFLTP